MDPLIEAKKLVKERDQARAFASAWKEAAKRERDEKQLFAARVIHTLELAMVISLKHEPCGYYCDEAVGHVDHRLFNWARASLGEAERIKKGFDPD